MGVDLLDRLGLRSGDADDGDDLDVPDDASELLEDDAEEELPKDPKPSRRKARLSLPEGPTKATPAEKRQVKDALSLIIKAPAGLWSMRDPHCGGALHDQADAIIKASLPIICRNPAMLRWFTAANAPWLDIAALVAALAPVVGTIYGHHVTHTVGAEEGAPDVDLSAYAAPRY
jgi:hypothetical protein